MAEICRLSQKTPPYRLLAAGALSEVFAEAASDAAAAGFSLASLAREEKPILWIQDAFSEREAGTPSMRALPGWSVIRVTARSPLDALWAMEQGVQSSALAMVIGEIWGDPPALNFTATKRLAIRAETSGTACWLIRRAAAANLSAARNRWRVSSAPSMPHPHDSRAPGAARWRVELFRSRQARPGQWIAWYDRETHRLRFDTPFRDGAVAEDAGAERRDAAR